ncbi:MAG: adenosylcobinamide amidohydrolase, partial [Acidimicrobiia bacterium]
AEARIPAANAAGFATGTATDAICLACPLGEGLPFAGPATRIGGEIARAVHRAVLEGALNDLVCRRERRPAWSSSSP